jgi:choline dehydrogenase-like flavoprotein
VQYDYDVIVVGGGAGGATFAYACASAGKSVLVLERGDPNPSSGPSHDEQATIIEKRPYDDREVAVNGTASKISSRARAMGSAFRAPSGIGRSPTQTSSRTTPRPSASTVSPGVGKKISALFRNRRGVTPVSPYRFIP